MTLATYYPFTQTQFYQTQLTAAPWTQILIFLVIALGLAMVSNIQYAKVPRIGVRTRRGRLGLIVHLTLIGFAIWSRDIFFFPLGITYLAYGMVRSAVVGIQERGEEPDEDESESSADDVPFLVRDGELGRHRRKRGM
jgi:CDP-diacylglycerol--serine O-phosphatidyltransferase